MMRRRTVKIIALLLALFFGIITMLGVDMIAGELVTDKYHSDPFSTLSD